MADTFHLTLDDDSDAIMFRPQTLDLRSAPSRSFDNLGMIGQPMPKVGPQDPVGVCTFPSGEEGEFFDVLAERDANTGLGLKLFVMPTCISVSRVGVGAIANFNEKSTGPKVQMNDFILEVNGHRSIDQMAQGLREREPTVLLRLYRAPLRRIILNTEGRRSGIRVRTLSSHSLVYIEAILDGVIASYNDQVRDPDHEIKMHDCLVSINGVYGDADRMLLSLTDKSATTLELLIVRPLAK